MTIEDILRNIYLKNNPYRLLSDSDYFINTLANNFNPEYKTDYVLLEKAIKCGAGNILLQFISQNAIPTQDEKYKFISMLSSKASIPHQEASRSVDLLLGMAGLNNYSQVISKPSLISAVNKSFKQYFKFYGRTGRKEFLYFILFSFICNLTLPIGVLIYLNNSSAVVPLIISVIINALLIIPGLSAFYRRLQDGGRSGMYLFLKLLPGIGDLLIFIWELSEGNSGVNLYGSPDPF